MVEKTKSLKINMALNVLKGISGVVFPLITFPYVSRVLGITNVGKVNFVNSIISYFVLIAGLGINMYAISEGSKYRDNVFKFKRFVDEIFSINLFSTILSYILLILLLIRVPKFHSYIALFIILSSQIVFKTIGIEWIYSICEDYLFITVRGIAFNVLSLVLLLLFVKVPEDVYVYAFVMTIATVGSNILNFVHARKYCRIGVTLKIDWQKHLKPVLLLFATMITVTIYVNSDITILGFLCNDETVGVYAVSSKIYTIVKGVVASIVAVTIPRLSALIGKADKDAFACTAKNTYGILLTATTPTVIGIILLRRQIVLLIAGEPYISAASSLALLSIALFFCMGAYFWGQAILVPMEFEKTLFKATITSAIVNIVLNFVLIPLWKENAAALTTLLSEVIACVWCMLEGRKYAKIDGTLKTLGKILIGCFGIVAVDFIISSFQLSNFLHTITTIVIAALVYFAIEHLLKNEVVLSVTTVIIKKGINLKKGKKD